MAGKITVALTRKEASTYRSHGLAEEARDLYKKLLSSSPNLSSEIKASIKEQIQQIEIEIASNSLEECQAISDEQITVIKQGWRNQPSLDEILTCAITLYKLKRFGDALAELKKLRRNVDGLKRAKGAIAACLIQLHGPDDLPAAADKLAGELFQNSRAALLFQAAIAETVLKYGYREHACSILRHVGRHKDLSPQIQKRIFALARKFGCADSPLRSIMQRLVGCTARPH
jgi:hypothetical protein